MLRETQLKSRKIQMKYNSNSYGGFLGICRISKIYLEAQISLTGLQKVGHAIHGVTRQQATPEGRGGLSRKKCLKSYNAKQWCESQWKTRMFHDLKKKFFMYALYNNWKHWYLNK